MGKYLRVILVVLLALAPGQASVASVRLSANDAVGMAQDCGPVSSTHAAHSVSSPTAPSNDDGGCNDCMQTTACVVPCLSGAPGVNTAWNTPDVGRGDYLWGSFRVNQYLDFFPPVDPRPPQIVA